MRQHISREQLNELKPEEQAIIFKDVLGMTGVPTFIILINIGQLIQFLGNDLSVIEFKGDHYVVYTSWEKFYEKDSLIDNLWEAAKRKVYDRRQANKRIDTK